MYLSCGESETLRWKSADKIIRFYWNFLVGGMFACSPMMLYWFTELAQ